MRTFEQQIAAGDVARFPAGGTFQILSLTDAVDVKVFDENRRGQGEAKGVLAGLKLRPKDGFSSIEVRSATTQTIKVGVSDGDSEYDNISVGGTVTTQDVIPTQITSDTQSIAASGYYLVAQNSDRAELIVTNDGASTAYVALSDDAAKAYGILIPAGMSFTLQTTAAVYIHNLNGAAVQTVYITEVLK